MEKILAAQEFLKSKGIVNPQIGVILGTGLGNLFVKEIEDPLFVPYDVIPHFPVSTVETHHGKLIFGKINGVNVLAMQGRFAYYEGYTMQQVTFPVRVMKALGVQKLLISNAAGSLNPQWSKGEMMVIEDHINLLPDNPLRGPNLDEQGPRFPDMSAPYDATMNEHLMNIGEDLGINMRKGVYAAVLGPNLETRAEYRFLKKIGADAVGMSTVPEVIVANHCSIPCCAISVLTDDCNPEHLQPIDISEIIAIAGKADPLLTKLFTGLIQQLKD